MKKVVFLALLMISSGLVSAETEYLDRVESEVFSVPNKQASEILEKVPGCIAKFTGSAHDRSAEQIAAIEDGSSLWDVIIPDPGFGSPDSYIKSRLTVMAKEGRFKIKQEAITRALREGFGKNTSYKGGTRVGKWFGSGFAPIKRDVEKTMSELAACIVTEAPAENW